MTRLTPILITLFCFIVTPVFTRHIVGGDIKYTCVSSNSDQQTTTFAVSFTMYRDVLGGGANYDLNAQFGIYRKSPGGSDWTFVQAVVANPTNIANIPLNDPCVTVPPNIRTERGSYNFNVTLPWGENIYQIAYQRCCRNNTINNIFNPGTTGAVFSVEITQEAIRNCNNSPVFKKLPPIILCNNRPIMFDHGTTDMEGDSVVYEFCNPLSSGGNMPGDDCFSIVPAPFKCLPPYPEVSFVPPYTSFEPMGGNPIVNINASTGMITGTPNVQGQYVVGICIREYRNGKLLTSTRRDFQFNVLNCNGITFDQNYLLCENDSLRINEVTYTQPGTYTQNFITESGCDSVVVIKINPLKNSESLITKTICFPENYTFFEMILTQSGTYTKILENSAGCDSTVILKLLVNQPTENTLHYSLCDGEILEINGESFSQSGVYSQKLVNSNGCDSILTLIIRTGTSLTSRQYYSLCNAGSFEVNNVVYNSPGVFVQNLNSQSGCDSTLIVNILPCQQDIIYDFQLCDAKTPQQGMNYEEFVPRYLSSLSCGTISASNIEREQPQENKHSCTLGHESSLSMCVSVSNTCIPEEATQKPVVFGFRASPVSGSYIKWNHLVFHHNAPLNYNWINGATGPNNYPTKIRIRIYKNDALVFAQQDIPTNNTWKKEKLDLYENPDYVLQEGDSVRVELLPYCTVGNTSTVSVWDVDNLSLFFSCEEKENRIIGGKLLTNVDSDELFTIKRYQGNKVLKLETTDNFFLFPKNDPLKNYIITGLSHQEPSKEVSTFDLVLIQKHILGIETFSNPFQFIAADVNRDGKINSADLVIMRKVILGVYENFPDNTSWRLIPRTSVFETQHPLKWSDEMLILPGYENLQEIDFIPIKTGDVSGALNIEFSKSE